MQVRTLRQRSRQLILLLVRFRSWHGFLFVLRFLPRSFVIKTAFASYLKCCFSCIFTCGSYLNVASRVFLRAVCTYMLLLVYFYVQFVLNVASRVFFRAPRCLAIINGRIFCYSDLSSVGRAVIQSQTASLISNIVVVSSVISIFPVHRRSVHKT